MNVPADAAREQARNADGTFGVQEHDEPQTTLGPVAPSDWGPQPTTQAEMVSALYARADRLCAHLDDDGSFTPVTSLMQTAADLRALVPNVDQGEFDEHLAHIDAAAANFNTVEAAEPEDTTAYEEQADAARLQLDEFPVEDYDGEGVYSDCEAFHSAVRDACSDRFYDAVVALADADLRAARTR